MKAKDSKVAKETKKTEKKEVVKTFGEVISSLVKVPQMPEQPSK